MQLAGPQVLRQNMPGVFGEETPVWMQWCERRDKQEGQGIRVLVIRDKSTPRQRDILCWSTGDGHLVQNETGAGSMGNREGFLESRWLELRIKG